MLPDLILGFLIGPTVPKPVSADVISALASADVNLSDDSNGEGQSGFQLRFAARRDRGVTANYALLSDPTLQPGNRLVITITIKAKPYVLMDGIITNQQLDFRSTGEGADLIITGRDIGLLMDLEQKAKGYEGMNQEAVVRTVLQAYKRLGIAADVTAPAAVWPKQTPQHVPFQQDADRPFLRKLATANGYIFFVRPENQPGKSTAVWGPPQFTLPEQRALTVDMGVDTNVEGIHFEFNALVPVKVTGGFADDNAAQSDKVDITTTKRKAKLAKSPALSVDDRLVRTRWLAYAGPDRGEATARAQSLTDRSTDEVIKVTGTLNTLVYGDLLRAPGRVGVRGVGATYDGLYRVAEVKHRITLVSYKQEFTLTREGPGANVRQVKP